MTRPNVFLDPGPELERAFRPVAEGLASQDGVLPASSQADADSYYGRAPGHGLESTQRALLLRTGLVIALARAVGWSGASIDVERVAELHDGIFRPVFGEMTLGYRLPPGRHEHRDDDGVEFPYWVVRGPGRVPELQTRRGVRSGQVLKRVGEACEKFEREAPPAIGDSDRGTFLIAQLYVRLIRTHPFGDGNGRTAWAAVQFAAGRLRLPFVQSSPTTDARVALGDALRHGTRVQPLANRIRAAMWADE
ncbi:MAG: Fic family protein [Patulibacter sp.]